ncbi:MAG: hypothetical protein A3C46_00520 [Deltaproteobacteria bacterium RIFCSPHIGHO2_02_FULL_44_16]|nr:MAG: hypothetical protein A3C46_00520 [Deltaproteobacteria bacterium RIFCSPHIGHO2_02_FULL_44_16]
MKHIIFQLVITTFTFALSLPSQSWAGGNPFPTDVDEYELTYETGGDQEYFDYLYVTFQPLSRMNTRTFVKECMSSDHGDVICDETDPQFNKEGECPGEALPPPQIQPGETPPAEPCGEVIGLPYEETLRDLVSEHVNAETGEITYKLSYQKGFLMYGFPIALTVQQFATPVLDVTKAQMASTDPTPVQNPQSPAGEASPPKPSDKIRNPLSLPEASDEEGEEMGPHIKTLNAEGASCSLMKNPSKPSGTLFGLLLMTLLLLITQRYRRCIKSMRIFALFFLCLFPQVTFAQTEKVVCHIDLPSGTTMNDRDCDNVTDVRDFCPDNYDPGQSDRDGDRVGDACDNCPYVMNPGQEQEDGKNHGIACAPDLDRDGFSDEVDVCSRLYNPDQVDTDGDGVGDACEIVIADVTPIQNVPEDVKNVSKSGGCSLVFEQKPLTFSLFLLFFPLIPLALLRRSS